MPHCSISFDQKTYLFVEKNLFTEDCVKHSTQINAGNQGKTSVVDLYRIVKHSTDLLTCRNDTNFETTLVAGEKFVLFASAM